MITGSQICAARALLNWSTADTAHKSGLTRQTLHRLESSNNEVPGSRTDSLIRLRKVFEDAGIEFLGDPQSRPGVRLR